MTRGLALLAVAALGACVMVAPPPPTDVPQSAWILPGTSWKLVELDGKPYDARAVATLTDDGRITGQAPCNSFNASYTGHWPDLRFQPAATTRMACPDLAAESAFFGALAKVDHAAHDQGTLLLTGPGTSLRFVRG